ELHERLRASAIRVDVYEDRSGRDVHIPDVVMNKLAIPDHLAGLDVEAHDRIGIKIRARPMPAVAVARSGFHRYIHVAEVFVDREARPGAGIAGVFIRTVQPRFRARLAFARNGMESPDLLSRANIESHDVALHVFLVGHRSRQQRRTDNYNIVRNHGWRAVADMTCRIAFEIQIQFLEQVDDSITAETLHRNTRLRIQRR